MKKWYAVIGDPIAQSSSPRMHDAWLEQLDLDATYVPIHIREGELNEGFESMKRLGASGWNVTVPHKEAIVPLLDRIDPLAQRMQAVNTVVIEDGAYVGYNTDGIGFVRSLQEAYPEHEKGNVLLIGAGGAAKGIAFAMQQEGYASLTVANRSVERADALARALGNGARSCTLEEAERQFDTFDVVVQTTSVGMNFATAGTPLPVTRVKEGAVVADIIYNPLETEFLRQAKRAGARTLNGLGMFVHQGAESFEKWTGIRPDTKSMIQRLTDELGGTTC